jgi:hypothetical protein
MEKFNYNNDKVELRFFRLSDDGESIEWCVRDRECWSVTDTTVGVPPEHERPAR